MILPELFEVLDTEPEETRMFEDQLEYQNYIAANCEGGSMINVFHLNVRSLQKNYDELVVYLNSFNKINIDVIILSETFVLPDASFFNITGFHVYYSGGELNKNDGVVMYIKDCLTIISIDTIKLTEITLLRAVIDYNNIAHGITAFYRLPSASADIFIAEFSEFLSNLNNNQIEVYGGDVNIDLTDKNNKLVNEYYSLADNNGFISYINKPTRITSTSATCIDHFFVRNMIYKNEIKVSGYILENAITDHYPILLNLHYRTIKKTASANIKSASKLDLEKLNDLLSEEKWTCVLECDEPISATNTFVDLFKTYLQQCTTNITLRKKEIKLKPWVTPGILSSIRTRDKLKKKILKYATPNDNQIEYFKKYRNQLTKIIKLAKYQYYKNKINSNTRNYKNMWNIIREASGYSQNKNNCIKTLEIDGVRVTEASEIAKHFNHFFINVGVDMGKKFVNGNPNLSNINRKENTMFIPPIQRSDLILLINKLKNNSSPGRDGITPKVIKSAHVHILVPLQHIINSIINTGIVPLYFKTSIVIPIHKNGSKLNMNNYRPISLINCFAKLFEMHVKNCLMSFVESFDLISKKQFGFLGGLSTESAIYKLISGVLDGFDARQCTLAVFLDLAKAFDTVPHDRLLNKLEHMGIRGQANKIFFNYLKNRIQYVRINNEYSEPQTIKIGIPQGTVLGPILFLLYINDLYNVTNSEIISYADDTAIVCTAETWSEVKILVERELSRVREWLNNNHLTLNVNKTKFVAFSVLENKQPNFNKINLSQTDVIAKVSDIKYLGVMIDQHLRWDVHANWVAQKMRRICHVFYILRNILPEKTLRIVYSGLVEAILRYGIVVWGTALPTNLHNLQVAQNNILKVMLNLGRLYPTHDLYKTFKFLDIKSIYFHSLLCWVHKNKNTLQTISHQYSTRSNAEGLYVRGIHRTNICQRQPKYIGTKSYNTLPNSIKTLTRFKTFSKQLKNYILESSDIP